MRQPTINEVFIPGGMPQTTYVSREHLGIEASVEEWSQGPHTSLLSVSGPTKTGKTVLLKRFFPEALWLSGGALETAEELWESVCDTLEVFTDHDLSASSSDQQTKTGNATVSAGVAQAGGLISDTGSSQRTLSRSRRRSNKSAAREALRLNKPTLIIDDFHYLESDEQIKIIRGVKDLVFEGLPVILVSVPHRAFDAVRVEKEMTGRLDNISLGNWDNQDLEDIARKGFSALSLNFTSETISRLATESFGSPHLMQTHCLALGRIAQPGDEDGLELDWDAFFRARAGAASKTAFDLLKQGPRQRNDRNVRVLKNGIETDIYGAVLSAIAHTGPMTSMQYEDVRAALRKVLESDLPQRHEITNILDQMTRIARDKIAGEPVIEYDNEYSTLYIADPFFAYYLRWAPDSSKELNIETR